MWLHRCGALLSAKKQRGHPTRCWMSSLFSNYMFTVKWIEKGALEVGAKQGAPTLMRSSTAAIQRGCKEANTEN